MSPIDQDDSQDSDKEVVAFEQQLRSICPSPPAQSWSSVADAIEASLDQPTVVANVKPLTSAWRSLVSHSITTAIGAAIGVAVMLALPQNDSVSNRTAIPLPSASSAGDFGTQHNLSDEQPDKQSHRAGLQKAPSLATGSEASSWSNQRSASDWQSQRFTRTALHSGPLRILGSINDFSYPRRSKTSPSASQNPTQRRDSDDDDSTIEQIDGSFFEDEPVLSPRSLHLFFDELT